jgi:ketosteroid isomerase-like protein
MTQCRECGADIYPEHSFCQNCGAPAQSPQSPRETTQGQRPPGQQGRGGTQQPGGQQSRANHQPQGSRQGQGSQPPQSPPPQRGQPQQSGPNQQPNQPAGGGPGGPPTRGPQQGNAEDEGIDRRTLLIGGAGLTAILAGGFLLLGDGSADDPESVVEHYYQAAFDGDIETVNELLHEDSPSGEFNIEELSDQQKEYLENTEIQVEETKLLEDELDDEDRTVVEITYTVNPPDGSEESRTQKIELRTQDGEWKIWAPYPRTQVNQTMPSVSFTYDYHTDMGALTITHTSGDTVSAGQLRIVGENIDSEGFWYTFAPNHGPASEVSAGDSIEIGAQSNAEVQIIWESPSGDTSATLGDYQGPDA